MWLIPVIERTQVPLAQVHRQPRLHEREAAQPDQFFPAVMKNGVKRMAVTTPFQIHPGHNLLLFLINKNGGRSGQEFSKYREMNTHKQSPPEHFTS